MNQKTTTWQNLYIQRISNQSNHWLCRITAVQKFKTRSGFKQYDVILTKEQLVLTKRKSSFEAKNMQTQYNALGFRIDIYFNDSKLATEIDESGNSGRNIDYEINRRQKSIEQELGCAFIRIDPLKEDFYTMKAINHIFRHIQ